MKESKKRLLGLLATTGACAVILVGSAFAWFNYYTKARVSSIKLGVVNAYDLRLSLDNVHFHYNVLEDFGLNDYKQVSGNGSSFYKMVTGFGTPDSNGVQKNVLAGFQKIERTDYDNYLYFKNIYINVEKDIDLILHNSSSVIPADISTRLTDFGKSKDYIAGAIRVGILGTDEISQEFIPLFIWAPNSTYQYTDVNNVRNFTSSGVVEDNYYYATGSSLSNVKSIATGSENNGRVVTDEGFVFAWGDIPLENQFISKIEAGRSQLAFAVWLEGTDRECVTDFTGGEVEININFTSQLSQN